MAQWWLDSEHSLSIEHTIAPHLLGKAEQIVTYKSINLSHWCKLDLQYMEHGLVHTSITA
jgi:hypothetical protein